MTDNDSPWKEALAIFFQDFMAYFFPQAATDIDWSRGYEVLLIRGLYERGFTQEQVRYLFRAIDWMMRLPADDDRLFWQDVQQYEQEKKMPYIPPEERMRIYDACDRFVEAIEVDLEVRFGAEGLQLMPALRKLYDLDALRAIHRAALTANSLEELRALVPASQPQ